MPIQKVSYSESMKMTTEKRFESRLVSVSAELRVLEGEDIQAQTESLKKFVKAQLQKELPNPSG